MGMAASQARYLSLTARKTNTEYQGQQVNQERTALANQSAGLFNQMLSLEVPTPPVATDYTKTYYTFTEPSKTNATTISIIVAKKCVNNSPVINNSQIVLKHSKGLEKIKLLIILYLLHNSQVNKKVNPKII